MKLAILPFLFLAIAVDARTPVPQISIPTCNNICFIENKGQIKDQYGAPRNDIAYKVAGTGISFFIGSGHIHYQWYAPGADTNKGTKSYRMDVVLQGADKNAQVVAEQPQTYTETYYNVAAQTSGVKAAAWKKITYKNIYPHIDWVLYINDGNVEYDFVVRPGGNASLIKLKYLGATKLHTADGTLLATTPLGSIKESALHAYEEAGGKKIAVKFFQEKNTISFVTGHYSNTLVIDPLLQWGTYFGGGTENGTGSTADSRGNVYITGYTTSTTNIATTGAFASILPGTTSAYIARFSKAGALLWATYYGGSAVDKAAGMAWDGAGNIYVTGSATSSTGIATPGAYQATYNGSAKAFLVKFDTSGNRVWGTYIGGNGQDAGYAVCCDHNGSVYVVAKTTSTTGIATAGSYQTTLAGVADVFLAKFGASGNLLWSTYYGGSLDDAPNGIVSDNSNNVYMVGHTSSLTGIATPGSYRQTMYTTSSGGVSGFLAKFNSAGALQWGTYMGNGGVYDVAYDASSNTIYISGNDATNTLGTPGAFQQTIGSGGMVFLAKLNTAGQMQWCTYYGGTLGTGYSFAACDSFGNIWFVGNVQSGATNIATATAYQSAFGGSFNDLFLAKFNTYGGRLWGSYYGGSGNDVVTSLSYHMINCQGDGNVNIAFANTSSTNNIATTGSYQSSLIGSQNAAVISFYDTSLFIRYPFTDTQLCAGAAYALHYVTYVKFLSGNVFTAQLSDATGSFASPVNIGTLPADTTGIINCTIPPNTISGAGYRIRVVASKPAIVYPDEGVNIRITKLSTPAVTSNTPVCVGNNLILGATDSFANASYSWAGPNAYTSSNQNPTITNATAAASGIYTVTASAYGCSKTKQDTVLVSPATAAPSIHIAASPSDTFCGTTPITFTATTANAGTTPTYTWRKNGVIIPGAVAATYTTTAIANGDQITCSVLSNAPCQLVDSALSNIIVMHIAANTIPPVSISIYPVAFTPGTNTTFTAIINGSSTYLTFQWERNGVPIPGATSSSYSTTTFSKGDVISLVVRSTLACTHPDSAVVRTNPLSIPGTRTNDINIYPNPVTSTVYINASEQVNVSLCHTDGRNILYVFDAKVLNMDLLAGGVYLLKIYDKDNILLKVEKLVKVQ